MHIMVANIRSYAASYGTHDRHHCGDAKPSSVESR